ncbi:MAG TPA: dienelactone hydrolase family protein [Xanthobacteraceae bacterium]|nr:dienelactone hydrolase family protein [Xanthobacteraceae bacterium]
MAKPRTDIDDFARRDLTFLGKTKPVLTMGTAGPAVIVVHEVYGFTPTLARFCRWIRDGGFRVYAPVLFGSVDTSNPERILPSRLLGLCISREFYLFAAGKSSPVVEWLKELARLTHRECGELGVGAVGMCLTGNFALAMAVVPEVLAPVLAQPGLPSHKPAALDVSASDLAAVRSRVEREGFLVRGYRFQGDVVCRAARFETLRRELGNGFVGITLPDSAANPQGRKPPHSVFTTELIDAAGQPTRAAVDEVVGFFRERLRSRAGAPG